MHIHTEYLQEVCSVLLSRPPVVAGKVETDPNTATRTYLNLKHGHLTYIWLRTRRSKTLVQLDDRQLLRIKTIYFINQQSTRLCSRRYYCSMSWLRGRTATVILLTGLATVTTGAALRLFLPYAGKRLRKLRRHINRCSVCYITDNA